jgi:hypothetical protein
LQAFLTKAKGGTMFQRIAEFESMSTASGAWYRPRVYGDVVADGTWGGWIVFFPVSVGPVFSTRRETTQTSLAALRNWAMALDQIYLEGAFVRALDASAGVPIKSGAAVDAEHAAAVDAVALHRAAETAAVEGRAKTALAEMHERAAAAAREEAETLAAEQKQLEELAADAHESAARDARAIAADAGKRGASGKPKRTSARKKR